MSSLNCKGPWGRYYALRDGETTQVASGIEEHYSPRSASAPLPTGMIGAIVGTADRIDSIVGLLGIGKVPTGSADPFALRRAAAAIAQVAVEHQLSMSLSSLIAASVAVHQRQGFLTSVDVDKLCTTTIDFMRLRIRSVMAERSERAGHPASEAVVDAVLAARDGVEDLPDVCRRTLAVAALLSAQPAGFAALAATFKRVGNIVAQARDKGIIIDSTRGHDNAQTDAERALVQAVATMTKTGDHDATLAAVVALKPLVDAFFVDAMVMVDDHTLRDARLSLLARIEERLMVVCDFTRMPAIADA
jgi:glycyl-tRNA synthetase beta chain